MKRWIITENNKPNIDIIEYEEEIKLFRYEKNKIETEKKHWNNDYEKNKYSNVFSITDNKNICKDLTKGIRKETKNILIVGCGIKTNLQSYIIKKYKHIESIHCTDWSETAIEKAKENYSHKKITYENEDTSNFSYKEGSFDYIIISNSILSNSDLLNRKMIEECYRVLKKSGFLGIFHNIQKVVYTFFPIIINFNNRKP
jgi:ubiquinone/menaquinone biosynthesis C-methylase UbiE